MNKYTTHAAKQQITNFVKFSGSIPNIPVMVDVVWMSDKYDEDEDDDVPSSSV